MKLPNWHKGDTFIEKKSGNKWKAASNIVTKKTGIAFVRHKKIVELPYITLTRGGVYIHVGIDKAKRNFKKEELSNPGIGFPLVE